MPPEPDPTAGRACIWAISCFLFICIAAGGGCLLAYLTVPESQSSNLLPILGFVLVCMPWIFWIVTIVYRITSRAFGFRMVIGSLYANGSVSPAKGGGGSGGGATVGGNDSIDGAQIVDVSNAESTPPSSPDKKDDGIRNNIQSSGNNNNNNNNNNKDVEEINSKGGRRSSSSSSSSDISHESEMPLALAL